MAAGGPLIELEHLDGELASGWPELSTFSSPAVWGLASRAAKLWAPLSMELLNWFSMDL